MAFVASLMYPMRFYFRTNFFTFADDCSTEKSGFSYLYPICILLKGNCLNR